MTHLNKDQIKNLLPHREPMLLIDELYDIKKLTSATGIVKVKKESFFVQGHFPDQPVMPGVLIVEAFGQAAAALTAHGLDKSTYEDKLVFLMGVEKARFRNPVIPDCDLLLKIEENSRALLKLISASRDFNNLIKDPTVSRDVLNQVIKKISDSFNLEVLFRNFLSFLIIKRRFFYIQQILKSFNSICSEKRGELKAEIKSAKNLTQDEINKITQELSKSFKSEIKLNYTHDQSLIGGLVVQIGSTMIDTSIKKKLQQLETRMIEA